MNAASEQVRETFIKAGMDTADRLRHYRSTGENFYIGASAGGGLFLIEADMEGRRVLRFGSHLSPRLAHVTKAEVDLWNAREPNHPVVHIQVQEALERECAKIFLLLHQIRETE